MPRIYGDRIILREYKSEDLKNICKWANNSAIIDNSGNNPLLPQSYEHTKKYLEKKLHEIPRDKVDFAIADKNTDEYIGQINLRKINYINKTATLGILLGSEEKLGKGYGSEAIKLILKFAFERLNLHKVELKVREFNVGAEKCYKKCGFKEEARIRENIYIYGRYYDTIHMGILRSEFEETSK